MDQTKRDNQISTEFEANYNKLDKWMLNALKKEHRPAFSSLLRELTGKNPTIKRHYQFLQDMGDIRNFVTHSRKSDGVGLAVPTQKTLDEFRRITDLIVDPPLLLAQAVTNLKIHSFQDSLSFALSEMQRNDFSQLVVKDSKEVHRLITREGIAKWLESNIEDDVVSITETTIEQVLSCEDIQSCRFVPRACSIFEGLEAFIDPKRRIQALILTHSGNAREKPLGLLTAYDIARIALVYF